jgi:hypothetical protein
MKLKSFIFLFLFSACVLSLFACSEPEISFFLTVEEQSVDLRAETAAQDISVVTNADSWTATVQSSAQSWLEARQIGASLRIIVAENPDFGTREGEILITAGDLSQLVTVRQMGQAPAILVTPNSSLISADGGDVTLRITSNIEYEIIIPADVEWVIPQIERATRATMITNEYAYSVAFNTTITVREAEIVIRYVGGSTPTQTVHIVQEGQGDFSVSGGDEVHTDIRVPVARGRASSFQASSPIEFAFDGNFNTIFHSAYNKPPNTFPVTLEFFFENQERIDYLVYHPRIRGSNGHIIETEIWVASHDAPGYVKIGSFNFHGTATPTRVLFDEPLMNPATVKFVVQSGVGGGQGFVSVAEMEFFRTSPDIELDPDPLTLFTDLSASELRPGVTLECIANHPSILLRGIAFHMYNNTYPREFRINNFRAWPHPRVWATENKTRPHSLLDNPTGISVDAGEDLIVFVGETYGRLISLKVIDFHVAGGDGWNDASSWYPLSPGVNRLRMQNRGLVYVLYHTSDWETAPPVTIHFASGRVSGYFDSQKHDPSEWVARLAAATDNSFDVIGRYAHLTFPTESFRRYAATNGPALIDAYDDIMYLTKYFIGLMKYNRPLINRTFFHVVHNDAFMFASDYRTGYRVTTANTVLSLDALKGRTGNPDGMWGPAHEVGHMFQKRPCFTWHGMTEVTVNIKSLWVQEQWGLSSRIDRVGTGRYNNINERAFNRAFVQRISHPAETDFFNNLVPFWQLQLYFANALGYVDTYKTLYEQMRIAPVLPTAGEQQLRFVRMISDITQTNLVNFFYKWGFLTPGTSPFLITDSQVRETIAYIESRGFSSPGVIEYITDSNQEIFRNQLSIRAGTAQRSGVTITMSGWQNVVAFEVYDDVYQGGMFLDNRLVFVSPKSSFRLYENPTANMRIYAVSFDGQRIPVSVGF